MPEKRITIDGEGSIIEVARGKVYRIRHRLPPAKPGGARRWSPMRTVHGNKAKARIELEAYRVELEDMLNNEHAALTVGTYAREFHQRRIDMGTLSPLSLERDEIEIVRIERAFGRVPVQELDAVLRRIDELQSKVNAAKAAQPDAYDRIMESWAVESTYNSNNIEGSTLSLGDTALLYDGAEVDGPLEDIRQAEGGFAALRFLRQAVDASEPFSESLVKRAHELAYAEAKDPATRGQYRQIEVEITGTDFQPAPAAYVPERMEQLVGSCARSKKHAAMVAALFHLEFESIHPFVNANGRTGRLMSNFLLMKSGYEPVNIQAESRARYIAAIRAFQETDNPYPFAAFFCLNLVERLQKVLGLLTGSGDGAAEWRASGLEGYLSGDDGAVDAPKYHLDTLDDTLENAILLILREDPSANQSDIAAKTGKSIATVKRAMKGLADTGMIRRVGGKRYGHWEFGE